MGLRAVAHGARRAAALHGGDDRGGLPECRWSYLTFRYARLKLRGNMPDRFIRFASAYQAMRERKCREVAGCDTGQLVERPYAAMKFWTTMVHERAGTNPSFAQFHRESLDETLKLITNAEPSDTSFQQGLACPDFAERVWRRFCTKTVKHDEERPNAKLTSGPVKGILSALRESDQSNVFRWLTRLPNPTTAWTTLQEKPNLNGIGRKLASFVLREVATFCGGWNCDIHQDNSWVFQPMDRWVLRCCRIVWPNGWPDDNQISLNTYYRSAARRLAAQFHEPTEAMKFNMGAWFVSAYFAQIAALHGALYVGDEPLDRLPFMNTLGQLNPDGITDAICITPTELMAKLNPGV
jgi:hypothetical protein